MTLLATLLIAFAPPGALNPAVTQGNIQQTICVKGWTKTIRPPARYTNALKRRQMREQKLPGPVRAYEEDHLVPLEIGGHPTDPRNLWPQPWAEARKKDRVEDYLHHCVCSGILSLREAQGMIRKDWTVMYQRITGVRP